MYPSVITYRYRALNVMGIHFIMREKKEESGVSAQIWKSPDYDYLKTMGVKIIEGRNFSKEMASDSTGVIINRTMAGKLGSKEPLGKLITNGWEHFRVIGVMNDFNYETMKQVVEPLCMVLGNNYSTIVAVKMNPDNTKNTTVSITSIWKKFAPDQTIRFTFMDENFANMYTDVERMGHVSPALPFLQLLSLASGYLHYQHLWPSSAIKKSA